jgi:hypothetical protein
MAAPNLNQSACVAAQFTLTEMVPHCAVPRCDGRHLFAHSDAAHLNCREPPSHPYADANWSTGPGPLALSNIGQESCEGHMAFLFRLHTPGPTDLDLRGKLGARTREMSMGWRRSFGQSTNLPIMGAAFAPLRHATTPSCDAKLLSRRIRQIVGVLVVLLIAAVTSTITFAQEPSPVQKAAENYYPKLVKKFPPNVRRPVVRARTGRKPSTPLGRNYSDLTRTIQK